MNGYANPARYWEDRLHKQFDLVGVGYNGLGPRYNAIMYQERLVALEQALATVGQSLRGKRVLEVGCGSGFYTAHCQRAGVADYIGVDLTAVSVRTLQDRYPDYRFVRANIADGLGLSQQVDVVLIADVLFHIVDDEAFAAALRHSLAALAPGGLLIISDGFLARTFQPAAHVRHRSLEAYDAALLPVGATRRALVPVFAVLHPPIATPDAGLPWRTYAQLWRYGARMVRFPLFDRLVPQLLRWAERRVLPRYGMDAPNTKWMIVIKDHVA